MNYSLILRRGSIMLAALFLLLVGALIATNIGSMNSAQAEPEARVVDLSTAVANAQRTMILAERAENKIIRRCMQDEGFEFPAPTGSNVPLARIGPNISPLSTGEAAKDGYKNTGPIPRQDRKRSQANDVRQQGLEYIDSLSDSETKEFRRALEGTAGDSDTGNNVIRLEGGFRLPMGGCIGDARRQLMGGQVREVHSMFQEFQMLPMKVDVSSDQEVQKKERSWQECMSNAGYSELDTPMQARGRGIEMGGGSEYVTDAERELASADARCREESGIVDAVQKAYASQNEKLLRENSKLIEAWQKKQSVILKRVGDVLGREISTVGN